MIKDIFGHFARLHHFSGREKLGSFWPYAGIVFGIMMVTSMAVFMPEMNRSMARMAQYAADHPESATVSQGPGHYEVRIEGHHPELMPDFENLIGGMAAVMVVTILLLAAAVTRRLHDAGRTGTWGLLPLPFLVAGMSLMPGIFNAAEPNLSQFFKLFAINLTYIASLILLVILLSRPGDLGENRFGPPTA